MVPTSEESFGARLRLERERRQIRLSSISDNTKISVSLLEALERGDVSRWPVGIYRRAFIRAYAEAVGLDAAAVTKEFFERFPDGSEPASHPEAVDAPAAGTPAPVRTAPVKATPAKAGLAEPVVRVTLPASNASFTRGRLLADAGSRVAAATCDAAVVFGLAATMFVVYGRFWAPLSATMLGYYLGGILLLGNTPGVCLLAPQSGIPEDHGRSGGGFSSQAAPDPGAAPIAGQARADRLAPRPLARVAAARGFVLLQPLTFRFSLFSFLFYLLSFNVEVPQLLLQRRDAFLELRHSPIVPPLARQQRLRPLHRLVGDGIDRAREPAQQPRHIAVAGVDIRA